MLVPLERAREHLRVDPGQEAELIGLYLLAAQQSAVDYLNRQVFADQGALDAAVAADSAGDYPMVVNAAIQAAVLLVLGHLYANREEVASGGVAQIPYGARSLLWPHRINPGF